MDFIRNRRADAGIAFDAAAAAVVNSESTEVARVLLGQLQAFETTPLRELRQVASEIGLASVYAKDESRRLGLSSFKALGGQYAVIRKVADSRADDADISKMVFVAATEGNHGISVAAGANFVGSRAIIFVPTGVNSPYIDTMKALGAEIVQIRGAYDDAVEAAAIAASGNGWTLVADTTDASFDATTRDVMAGYGILLAETEEQLSAIGRPFGPDGVSHVFIQGGVGGLAAAIAGRLWQRLGEARPKVVVVEPASADCLFQTALTGHVSGASGDLATVMSMLSCGRPSRMAWAILEKSADFFMTIEDDQAENAAAKYNLALGHDGSGTTPTGAAGLGGLIKAATSPGLRKELGLSAQSKALVVCTESAPDAAAAKATAARACLSV
jgi:diaminopropionate ammonia-lyase